MNSRLRLRYIFDLVVLAAIYHLVARLALQLAYVQANTTPVWPPSGIALAALLLLGMRYWPGIALGVVGGSLLTGAPLPMALGLGLANTLEALAGAYLLRNVIGLRPQLDRIRDVVGLASAAVGSAAISATIGVTTLRLVFGSTTPFFTLWSTWWVGNALGMLVVTSFLLVWATHFRQAMRSGFLVEGGAFLVLLILVSGYIFQDWSGSSIAHQALIYLIFPFAIWAALRLEQMGAVTAVLVVSGIAIWGTVHGSGPFSGVSLNDSLVLLQTFTGVVALTSLTLAASASERRQAEQALNRRVTELAALNDASKEFLGNLDTRALYASICRLVVTRLGLAAAWLDMDGAEQSAAGVTYQDPTIPLDVTRLRQHPAVAHTGQSVRLASKRAQVELAGNAVGKQPLASPSGGPVTLTALPLAYGGKVIGVLNVVGQPGEALAREQALLLESYANLAVVAIENSWLFDQVRLGNEQLHGLSQRLIGLQEQERAHLSRELHDEAGQILSALMVRLSLLERETAAPSQWRAQIAELKQTVIGVLNNLHTLAVKLRPASLDHVGLVTALQQYAEDFGREHNLAVQLDAVEIQNLRLPADTETALFRVVQESLTNAALHARASRVDILLNRRNGCVAVTVEDDGAGFDPAQVVRENRLGLFGMRERVEMLGGSMTVESAPGKGTAIFVEVPYGDTRADRR
jgi:signal transduction histidine kinase